MFETNTHKIRLMAMLTGLAALAACATPPPPPEPVPPPVPPVVKVIPPRPTPPGGASLGMYIPPRDQFGIRQTVNYGLSSAQTVWNLRAALNVAALNCQGLDHVDILPAYGTLLDRNKRTLAQTNDAITNEFRTRYGREYRSNFDNYMTQVYNYYALPPTQREFCDTSLQIAREYLAIDPTQLETFSMSSLPRIERVFQNFYTSYEQYRLDVAAWDAEFAPPPPVLVQGYTGPSSAGIYTGSAGSSVYSVDVAPSVQPSGSVAGDGSTGSYGGTYGTAPTGPVIVSQLPSSDNGVVFSPGVADPQPAGSDPRTGAADVNPGFSVGTTPATSPTGAPVVFESGAVVQATDPDDDAD